MLDRKTPLWLAAAVSTFVLWAGTPAATQVAQERAPAAAAPDPAAYDSAVLEIERLVTAHYVDTARKPAVLSALAEGRRNGRYRRADSPQGLAALVTEDLLRASEDGHMYVTWSPERHRSLSQAREAGPSAGDDSFWIERARRENAGLTDQRILSGNVRYLKVGAFLWDPATSPAAYDRALAFLQGGDAVVLDLRGNGGGSPDAVNYLASHFVPPNTRLMTFVMAGGEELSVSRADPPSGRIAGKPVYVLIDKGVASAGEEFAQHVEKFRFGELVGETTAGAGNRNELYSVGEGWVASVSVGLALHGTDGSRLQGVGIKPAVVAPSGGALDVAHARALHRLAEVGPVARRSEYAWAAEAVRARAEPPSIAAAALAQYVGAYGERTVRMDGDALVYQRAGGPAVRLKPMGERRFQFGDDEAVRVSFEVEGGRVAAAVVSYQDGRRSRFERTAEAQRPDAGPGVFLAGSGAISFGGSKRTPRSTDRAARRREASASGLRR